MADLKLKRALNHVMPTASGRTYLLGDRMLVSREKKVNNHIGELQEPYIFLDTDLERKLVYVRDFGIGADKPYNLSMVNVYFKLKLLLIISC